MQTVELRPLPWWDIPAAARMDREIFGADAWSEDFLWAQAGTPSVFIIGAYEGPQLRGFAALGISGREAEVLTIAVDPEFRGRGAGRLLLQALMDTASARGVEAVYLDVRSDNAPALGLYAAFGFEKLHVRTGYYADADALVMRAALVPLEA